MPFVLHEADCQGEPEENGRRRKGRGKEKECAQWRQREKGERWDVKRMCSLADKLRLEDQCEYDLGPSPPQ